MSVIDDVYEVPASQLRVPGGSGLGEAAGTSAGKALDVLDAFRDGGVLLGVTQVAERAHVPKSTAHRLLAVLVDHGYIERVGMRYRLGRTAFELGNMVSECRPRSLRELAMPYMTDLYASLHATVHLAVLDGTDVLYVEKIYGHRAVQVPSRVGGRLPALCTALGKAMISHSSGEIVEQNLATRLPRLSPRTVTSSTLLRQELERARDRGVAYDREGSSLGAHCLAAPVLSSSTGEVLAALSTSYRAVEPLPAQAERLLVRAAASLSAVT